MGSVVDLCFFFFFALLCVHSGFAIILMGREELVTRLIFLHASRDSISVVLLFLAVPRVCLQFVNVVFPDHTHLLY